MFSNTCVAVALSMGIAGAACAGGASHMTSRTSSRAPGEASAEEFWRRMMADPAFQGCLPGGVSRTPWPWRDEVFAFVNLPTDGTRTEVVLSAASRGHDARSLDCLADALAGSRASVREDRDVTLASVGNTLYVTPTDGLLGARHAGSFSDWFLRASRGER